MEKPLLVLIVGPTAVGKTEITIQLAECLGKRAFLGVYN